MFSIFLPARLFLLSGIMAAYACVRGAEEAGPSFRNEVLPILSGHCFECHGFDPGTRFPKDAPLRLDGFEAATAVRQDGNRAIVPGDPKASLVLKRVLSRDPDLVMPPLNAHKPLSDGQIQTLERWIEAGAEYEPHWAFVAPPEEIPVPETADKSWPRKAIDRFVLARLEKENRLTHTFQGRRFRLTDVHGHVVHDLLA